VGSLTWFPASDARRILRGCERILLLFGLAAVGVYVASTAYARLYQAYASYAFDRSLNEKEPVETGSPAVDPLPAADPSYPRSGESRAAKPPGRGPALGRLQIPSLRLSVMVLEGTDAWTLNQGVGHIVGTALPGRPGNVGIAGHRDTYFNELGRVSKRDRVFLTTRNRRDEYRIYDVRIVDPEDTKVLAPSRTPRLTLVTCYPFDYVGPAPKRFVVKAKLASSKAPRPKGGHPWRR